MKYTEKKNLSWHFGNTNIIVLPGAFYHV
uniref:Uncharacterized protein n=1 Tax=Anguilla anguilla TaxID=7936 RepID=A0A0E9UI24_ANGAN